MTATGLTIDIQTGMGVTASGEKKGSERYVRDPTRWLWIGIQDQGHQQPRIKEFVQYHFGHKLYSKTSFQEAGLEWTYELGMRSVKVGSLAMRAKDLADPVAALSEGVIATVEAEYEYAKKWGCLKGGGPGYEGPLFDGLVPTLEQYRVIQKEAEEAKAKAPTATAGSSAAAGGGGGGGGGAAAAAKSMKNAPLALDFDFGPFARKMRNAIFVAKQQCFTGFEVARKGEGVGKEWSDWYACALQLAAASRFDRGARDAFDEYEEGKWKDKCTWRRSAAADATLRPPTTAAVAPTAAAAATADRTTMPPLLVY